MSTDAQFVHALRRLTPHHSCAATFLINRIPSRAESCGGILFSLTLAPSAFAVMPF